MAPGPGGSLFVSIPRAGGSILALLDRDGRPRPGWPIRISDSTSCELLLPVDDGSVRVVCTLENPQGNMFGPIGAFAFDSAGSQLAGWPIDLGAHGYFSGRVIGDELTIHAWASLGDVIAEGQPAGNSWILTLAANGAVRSGTQVPFPNCCDQRWAIGPDGVAYGSINQYGDAQEAPKSSELVAVSFAGAGAGFPITIEGSASEPAFDAAGRIHLTVGTPFERPARTLVFDTNGQAVVGGSGELEIAATGECVGIEGSCPAPAAPLVGPDGTTFVVDSSGNRTTVVGLSPLGQAMEGWPYRSDAGHQSKGSCPVGTVCERYELAAPAIGPGNVLYLLHAASDTSVGGSIVAVGPDSRVRPGWPVVLSRPGAAFWSVVVGADGTAYALAIEPETGDASSATILAIASDSTVLYRTTIIDP